MRHFNNMMSWWSSPDAVSFASTCLQILVAMAGIGALILGIRSSQLQKGQEQQNLLNIAKANEEAAKANEEAAKANEEAAKANERAATLENQATTAQLELEKLKESQAPWVLTEEQKAKLNELLERAPKGKIEISFIISDAERVAGLARYLEHAFRSGVQHGSRDRHDFKSKQSKGAQGYVFGRKGS